jgi:hypothetical protein
MRWKITGETSGNLLNLEKRGRQRERGNNLGNHGKFMKGISKSRLAKIECWNCGKKGHLKKDYRSPKKQGDGQQEKNMEENVASDVLQDALIIYLDNIIDYWVLDSVDSFHATSHRKKN